MLPARQLFRKVARVSRMGDPRTAPAPAPADSAGPAPCRRPLSPPGGGLVSVLDLRAGPYVPLHPRESESARSRGVRPLRDAGRVPRPDGLPRAQPVPRDPTLAGGRGHPSARRAPLAAGRADL